MRFFQKDRLRIFAALLLMGVFGLVSFSISQSLSIEAYRVTPHVDLRGSWGFHNGDLAKEAWNDESLFREKVEVPKPLPREIRAKLKNVFWYRTRIEIPEAFRDREDMALSLGSIKGAYEIFWNGKLLGTAPTTTWEIFRVPADRLKGNNAVLTVRVEKSPTIFEGIVHLNPMDLAPALKMAGHTNHYYYETTLKPLIAGIFKLMFFLLFTAFFLTTPKKRELFSFALFSLVSASASALFSRIMPFYEDFYFKYGMVFFFNTLALGMIPFFTADFLRLSERQRSYCRAYGFFLVTLAFTGATFFVKGESVLEFYRLTNDWLPVLVSVPAILLSVWVHRSLPAALASRRFQIKAFAFFLGGNLVAASASVSSFLSYQQFSYRPFIDLLVFAGLGATLALDFQVTSTRSDAAKNMIPKWFVAFLSSGIQKVKLELPLIVLAVDTVGYTANLATLNEAEKDKFHEKLRAALLPLTTQFQAQKISERGDGGIFAWDYHSEGADRQKNLSLALAAARYLAELGISDGLNIQFRQGMAAGNVRGEMVGSDVSFLGDALIRACRLEPIAQPGTVLVDETLASDYEQELSRVWTEAKIKGVLYRARPLQKVS